MNDFKNTFTFQRLIACVCPVFDLNMILLKNLSLYSLKNKVISLYININHKLMLVSK